MTVPRKAKPRRILLLAAPGTQILDLVGPYQVFVRAAEIVARTDASRSPVYSVEVITTEPGLLLTNCGLRLEGHRALQKVQGPVDTLLIAGGTSVEEGSKGPVVDWLRRISPRVRRIGSVCTGAFLLAQAGLLNHRRATTHWKYCEILSKQHPHIRVERDPIFVRDANIYTSAGVTAGMDMALALVEEDVGSGVALQVARELVLYLRRPGGQSQFSAALTLQTCDIQPLSDLSAWVLENLSKNLSVNALAEHVRMSPRSFARMIRRQMNTTPAKLVETLRLEAARRRLQESSASLEEVARACGFRNCDAMRTTFQRVLRVAPGEYRRRFRAANQRARIERPRIRLTAVADGQPGHRRSGRKGN